MKKFWNKFNIVLICLIFGIVAIDQITKILLTDVEANILGKFLSINYCQNTGAAFSLLDGAVWVFIPLTIVFVALILWLYFSIKNKSFLLCFSTAFIVGGAIGNLIDRVFLGFVKDFISFSFFPAVFNFADSFITVGTILFIIYILFYFEKDKLRGNKKI